MSVGQRKARNFRGTGDWVVVSKAIDGCRMYDKRGEIDTKATANAFMKKFQKNIKYEVGE